MAMNNRGLGRGIQALFDGGIQDPPQQAPDTPVTSVPVTAIQPNPAQPRQTFTESSLDDLAQSIREHGILQPLLVRPGSIEGTWQLIAGERRLRAARKAGLAEVPVVCRSLDDHEALIVTLLENLQREDLNPIEEARGIEALKTAMNATIEQLSATLGQGKSTIGHALRLLKLPKTIQEDLENGTLSPSHARAIAGLSGEEAMLELRAHVLKHRLTSRETEELVAAINENGEFPHASDGASPKPARKPRDPQIVRLANDIGAILKCRAKISGTAEKGHIRISYDTNEQLFDLLEKLGLQLN